MLDTPDAFHLPAIPGYGFLKVDTSIYRRFRSGYVSGPASGVSTPPGDDQEAPRPRLLPTYNTLQQADSGSDTETELPRRWWAGRWWSSASTGCRSVRPDAT